MLGGPTTLMRIGMIGSAGTELATASIAAEISGLTLGTDTLTPTAFAAILWGLPMQSLGFLIFVPLFVRGLGGKITKVLSPGENGKVPILGYIIGNIFPFVVFAAMTAIQMLKSTAHIASILVAIIVFISCYIISSKTGSKFFKDWAMGFAILTAMIVGGILSTFI